MKRHEKLRVKVHAWLISHVDKLPAKAVMELRRILKTKKEKKHEPK